MVPINAVSPSTFELQALLWLGLILVLAATLHSLLLWRGNRREAGLDHVLAAGSLQGLCLLGHLARPWLGGTTTGFNLLLLPSAIYGLWALRRYAGLPARWRRWEWRLLALWGVLALALRAPGPAAAILLVILILGAARELRGLAQQGEGQTPALVCEGLAYALALAAVVSGLPTAFFSALRGPEAGQIRAVFAFGVLGAHQLLAVLFAQVQGQRVRQRLDGLVATDPLTGLASALGFKDRLDRAVGRSLHTGRTTSILVLELDGFDILVAEHGTGPMNFLLEAFARTLRQTLREADLTGRLEGCRFAALLHQTQPLEALLAAERLRAAWNELVLPLETGVHRPTLSGGVASTREAIQDTEGLMGLALGRVASVRMDGGNNVAGEPLPEG